MENRISAVVERGLLRPSNPLNIADGTKVELLLLPHVELANHGASDLSTHAQVIAAIAAIAAMPMEEGGRVFTGRDHDAILYKADGRQ